MGRSAHILSALSLFLVALLARLAALGRYVTPDELNWVYRSLGLRRALLSADWTNSIQSGHPGVTTTWIGALSAQLQLLLQPELQARLDWLGRMQQLSADNVEAFRHLYAFLNGGRLGVAIAISLALVVLYWHARPLIGAPGAFLGALLLALDPFFAGLSGLLHVDGLLATFSLLTLIVALRAARTGSRRLAALAGGTTALAVLTKTPGLLLLPVVALILLWPAARRRLFPEPGNELDDGEKGPSAESGMSRAVGNLLVWGATLGATTMLLLPALWSDPHHVLALVVGLSGRLVEDAVRPTFFLGRAALDHGPLFYPVVLFFRLSPVASVGLVVAFVALLRRRARDEVGIIAWLLLFALLFVVAISVAAKKFDRYALPSLVIMTFVGGWGLVQAAAFIQRQSRGTLARIGATAVLLQLAFLVSAWPHPLTAYNWLAGGNLVAWDVFPRGWGEDAGLAARQLNASLENPRQTTLFTNSLTGTAPFFEGEIVRLREPNLTRLRGDDVVLVLPQDRLSPTTALPALGVDPWDSFTVKGVGEVTAYNGLDAAAVQLPALSLEEHVSRFGPALFMVEAGSVFLPWPQGTPLALTWQRGSGSELVASYQLQLELKNSDGQIWLRREMPLLNAADHAPHDWPADAPQTVFYSFSLPPTLAPGDYDWVVKVFDDQARQQAAYDLSGAFAGTEAGVARIAVTPPPSQPTPDITHPVAGAGPLAGYESMPETATAGEPFSLDIWLRNREPESAVDLTLVAGGRQLPFRLQTGDWRAGQIYQVRPRWRLPLDLAPGEQALRLLIQEADGARTIAGPVMLGAVQVERRQRNFELGDVVDPLQVQVGDVALLQDVSVEPQGEQLLVHVTWQASQTTFTDYTTFVHLRDGEQTIAGADRQPTPPTSRWAAGEVINETYTLPRPAAGAYHVALGLYDTRSGERLPLLEREGAPLADDAYILQAQTP